MAARVFTDPSHVEKQTDSMFTPGSETSVQVTASNEKSMYMYI